MEEVKSNTDLKKIGMHTIEHVHMSIFGRVVVATCLNN